MKVEMQAQCCVGDMIEICSDVQQIKNIILFGDATCEPITKITIYLTDYTLDFLDFLSWLEVSGHQLMSVCIYANSKGVVRSLSEDIIQYAPINSYAMSVKYMDFDESEILS